MFQALSIIFVRGDPGVWKSQTTLTTPPRDKHLHWVFVVFQIITFSGDPLMIHVKGREPEGMFSNQATKIAKIYFSSFHAFQQA